MNRVLISGANMREARRLCSLAESWSSSRKAGLSVFPVASEKDFWEQFSPGRYDAAVVGFGDTSGFLCARRVWEADRDCMIVLIDDTERYFLRGRRIQLADFLLRPFEDQRFLRSLDRIVHPY